MLTTLKHFKPARMATITLATKFLQTSNCLYYTSWRLLKTQPLVANRLAVRYSNIGVYSSDTGAFYHNCRIVLPKRRTNLHSLTRHFSQKTEHFEKTDTFTEKFKKFWRGPTFKYWFIGVTAFSSWLVYYSLKSYKSTRVDVVLPLALPNHILVDRKHDINAIFDALGSCQRIGGNVRCVLISGPSGSGKSILSHFVAKELMEQIDWNPLGLPKSHTSVFLHGDTLKGFLLSLQAFAAKLKIKPIEIKKKLGISNKLSSTVEQCRAVLDLIREKLEKHPNWIIVIDNLQQGSSEDVMTIMTDLLLSMENASSWSKGTVILTSDGVDANRFHGVSNYQMKPRFAFSYHCFNFHKSITN